MMFQISHFVDTLKIWLRQSLGFWSVTALVAGNMIGSGIFLLPSNLAAIGTISLFSWSITGIGSLCLTYLFMTLSRVLPKVGGPYAYVHDTAGQFLGFQTAYCYWLAVWIGNAAIALAGTGYLSLFFPILQSSHHATWTAIGVVWLLTVINYFGVYLSSMVEVVTTILKILPILLIVILGWGSVHGHYYTDYWNITLPKQSDWHAISLGAGLTLWAFIGLESATIPADRIKNPKKIIPQATLFGTLIALIVYIVSSVIMMGMIPATQLQKSTFPFSEAGTLILGKWGSGLIAMGAIVACFGCLNGWILLQGQVPMSAAKDGLFPSVFAKKNRYKVPGLGLIISSFLITILLCMTLTHNLVKQFELIILLAVFATIIPYFYTGLVALFFKEKFLLKNKSMHFYLIISLSVIYTGWIILNIGEHLLALGTLLMLSSIPIYLLVLKNKSKEIAHGR